MSEERKLCADGWPCSLCGSRFDPCDCPSERTFTYAEVEALLAAQRRACAERVSEVDTATCNRALAVRATPLVSLTESAE